MTDETDRPLRAALYARVSTVDKGQDVEVQLSELRREAQQRGWVVTEYVEEGISGAQASRPALDRMMKAIRAGQHDVLLVWRFDRFARSVRHLLDTLDELRELGVDFRSQREQVDTTTPMGRFVFILIAGIAELERAIISERVKAGLRVRRERGLPMGGETQRVEVDREAAEMMLAAGRSITRTARALGVSKRTLRRRIEQWRSAGTPQSPPQGGAPAASRVEPPVQAEPEQPPLTDADDDDLWDLFGSEEA